MCLPDFQEFKNINENEPLIGFREWINPINTQILKSTNQDYEWNKVIEGPHEVLDKDSGIYAYNYYYYYHYDYHYNYYYNNYYHYNYGIILQWGKVAIHKTGYRSEFAKIKTLFTIRESDAKGPTQFLNWIKKFNENINLIAQKFEADTIHWQDYNDKLVTKDN